MSKPIPGQTYIVQSGDTLPIISTRAYGIPDNAMLIRDANQFVFVTANLDDVQPGEQLFIPVDPVMEQLRFDQRKLNGN